MIKLDVGVGSVAPLQLQIPFDHVVNHARILSVCKCLDHVGVDAAALESVYRFDQPCRLRGSVHAQLHLWIYSQISICGSWAIESMSTEHTGVKATPSLTNTHTTPPPAQVWFVCTDAAGHALLFLHRRCRVLRGPVHRDVGSTTLDPHRGMVAELTGAAGVVWLVASVPVPFSTLSIDRCIIFVVFTSAGISCPVLDFFAALCTKSGSVVSPVS